jgi:hypothetical protein
LAAIAAGFSSAMRVRRNFIFLCATVAILGGVGVWFLRFKSVRPNQESERRNPPVAVRVLETVSGRAAERKAEERRWSSSRNGAVQFYAKAIDQNGDAISGVKLVVSLSRHVAGSSRPVQDERIEVISDAHGNFDLTGTQAVSLRTLQLEKAGYLWVNPGLGSFDFRPGKIARQPIDYLDPSRRFIFTLWRKGPTVPVVSHGLQVQIIDEVTQVNLLTGRLSREDEKADLVIRTQPVANEETAKRGERLFSFEVADGGIIETSDANPFLAPDIEYPQKWQWLFQPADTAPGAENWKRNFYVKARNGRLRSSLSVLFEFSGPRLTVSIITNPSGSPLLEPDPEKQITDPEEIRRLDEATQGK